MSDSLQPQNIEFQNERSLSTLVRAINRSKGEFTLILVRCNYTSLRNRILEELRHQNLEVLEINLDITTTKQLLCTLQTEVGTLTPNAVMVFGLELIPDLDDALIAINRIRDDFPETISFPLVLWINDLVLQKFIKLAPDFYSYAGVPIQFTIATNELIELLQQEAEGLFSKILAAGAEQFLDDTALNLQMGAGKRIEIEFALLELQNRNSCDPQIQANQQFILARDAYANNQMEHSRQLFEESLKFWNTDVTTDVRVNLKTIERQACALFHLGIWWRRYGVLHRAEYEIACQKARDYYRQCVEILQQANLPELAAKFINSFAEVILQLGEWNELEKVAKTCVEIHTQYPHHIRFANAHAFLAELALHKSRWSEAKQHAEIAIATIEGENDTKNKLTKNYYQSWYRLLLALAQKHLGEVETSLHNLETAKAECRPEYNPKLYLRILEALREFYFEQHRFLAAFELKQEHSSIEQQYGFRAFIGAGRLKSQRQVIHPSLVPFSTAGLYSSAVGLEASQGAIAQEIIASGREQDVRRLIERISRDDCKLIVIHGPSGVGKSSLLTAGLVPALQQITAFDGREPLPVLVRYYNNWQQELGTQLCIALQQNDSISDIAFPACDINVDGVDADCNKFDQLNTLDQIIEQLRENIEKKLFTVLVFDQFEEFFFNCHHPIQRKKFWEFLQSCLDSFNLPFVKVIISLREDYLHYLLECDKITNLKVTKNDILNKDIRYAFGNFTPSDAKHVIQSLTQRSFYLEPELIDELVRDLAGDLEEVRPIELQVVGAQLQTENITTLAQYEEYGPKEKLVQRFLSEIINDCGKENERAAELVLYLLTDENDTRPLKTRAELAAALVEEVDKLDFVLEIFVKSGLVFLVPQSPADRYQLVHDYLVSFIRQQRGAELLAELEREKQKRKQAEDQLNKALKRRLRDARIAGSCLAALAGLAVIFGVQATIRGTNAQLDALSLSSEAYYASGKGLEALVDGIKAGKKLKTPLWIESNTQNRALATLQQAVYEVRETNRLEGHRGIVTDVTFSRDDKLIATASADKTVKIWLKSGKEQATLKHKDEVNSVSFSPDGKIIATGGKDKTVHLWQINGTHIKTLAGHSTTIQKVIFSPDGTMLVSASEDGKVQLWNHRGEPLQTLQTDGSNISTINFSQDSNTIAWASGEEVRFWNRDGRKIKPINTRFGTLAIRFNSDKKTITLFLQRSLVQTWSLSDSTLVKNIGELNYNTPSVVSLSLDGKKLASENGVIEVKNFDNSEDNSLQLQDSGLTSLSFSNNGNFLAAANSNNTVRLWDLKKRNLRIGNELEGYSNLVFDNTSARIAATSLEYTNNLSSVNLWNEKGHFLKRFSGYASNIAFSPTKKNSFVVSGGQDNNLQIFNSNNTFFVNKFNDVRNISSSPKNRFLAVVKQDNNINLLNDNGSLVATLEGHKGKITDVQFSPDEKLIISISQDKTAKLWQTNGQLITTLASDIDTIVDAVFSRDSQIIATRGDSNIIQLWNRNGSKFKTLTGNEYPINNMDFSLDSQKFVAVNSVGEAKLWSLDDNLLSSFVSSMGSYLLFTPDGKELFSLEHDRFGNGDNFITLWDLNGNSKRILKGHKHNIESVNFTDNGRIIIGVSSNEITFWQRNGQLIRNLQSDLIKQEKLILSPDKKIIAKYDEKFVEILNLDETVIAKFKPIGQKTTSLYFSSDGQIVITVSDNTIVQLWQRDGKLIRTIKTNADEINSVRLISKNNILTIEGRENNIKTWDSDGKILKVFRAHRKAIYQVAVSPDGEIIASASDDKTSKLWKRDGTLITTLKGHTEKVTSLAFSPDTNIIATASDDKTIKLWKRDGTLINTLDKHQGTVNDVTFSPDGEIIASASSDNTIRLWKRNGELIKSLKGHTSSISKVRFIADGKTIISSDGSSLIMWGRDGTLLKTQSNYSQAFDVSPNGKNLALLIDSNELGIRSLDVNKLLVQGCNQVRDYLKTNPHLNDSDRALCDDVKSNY